MKRRFDFLRNGKNKGISLVELIIAMAIMGILAMAVSPLIIRYIDKTRKVFDINTAETIYEAALLAMASPNDDVIDGWDAVLKKNDKGTYRWVATPDGYKYSNNTADDRLQRQGYYYISTVAWCRGRVFSGNHATDGENVLFKSVYDNMVVTINNQTVDVGAQQRTYTDEFLSNLIHDSAKGETDTHGARARRRYDGLSTSQLMFRYTKNAAGITNGEPECWLLMRRMDNGMPEVWIGYKSGSVRPTYRLYPDPCKAYTN